MVGSMGKEYGIHWNVGQLATRERLFEDDYSRMGPEC